jgi:hypothetical protein
MPHLRAACIRSPFDPHPLAADDVAVVPPPPCPVDELRAGHLARAKAPLRRYRVRVEADNGTAHVVLTRKLWAPLYGEYITVSRINLYADSADELLADARMKAKDMCRQLNGLED